MRQTPVILWFRNDLRLRDHPALHAALETGCPVLPIYVLDDKCAGQWAPGAASRWWLHHSLASLQGNLADKGAGLALRKGDSVKIITDLARETGSRHVFTGGSCEPWARRLDRAVADALAPLDAQLHRMRTTMMFHPESVRTQSGGAYSVYTPFAKACLALGGPKPPIPAPDAIPGAPLPKSERLEDWKLLPTHPDWAGGLRETWTPGEAGAAERTRSFLEHGLKGYATSRNNPGQQGTSMLSPHLHHGEISAADVWHQAQRHAAGQDRDSFIRELLWGEFSIHLLWQHQALPEEPLRQEFAAMPWRNDPAALRAWQKGQTGIPIVDAGMRQLWQTGWMHNRVRMIVASFLIKHLLIPWQTGEAWFWDTLVDADLANNGASWQWVAGCGADAAPYFRVFNPTLQGQKFDKAGDYVRHFVPELERLEARYIHAPWDAPRAVLARAGIELGKTYPEPIVDLAKGRARALEAYATIRSTSTAA